MWQRFSGNALGRYAIGLFATAVALLLRKLLDPLLDDHAPYITVLLTIIFLAMYAGVGPSLVAVIFGVLGVTYLFVEPRGSFNVHNIPTHIESSLGFLIASACIIIVGEAIRNSQRERAKQTAALAMSAAQLRQFLETAPTGLKRCRRDLRYLAANSAYAQLVGLPVDEILGRTLVEVMGVDGWEKIRPYVERVLRGERVEYETMLTYTKGGARVVHVVYTPEKEGEEVVGWIASVTDITEFRHIEKQLQIEKVEKLAAAGQLAASLAHEINNPLSAVINILYLLGRSEFDPTSAKLISMATNEIGRVARIVRQSLSYYRVGTAATDVDLAALVEESLQVFSDRFQRSGIALSRTITPATRVMGFADEIRQVVDNLLVNSEEATPRGGHVTVCLRQSRSWQHVNELGARLIVADNGCGIPRAYLPRVSDAFFTTKAEKGTGLGLWVVKGVVEKHGGNLKIRSSAAPGRSGTVISIFWPKEPTRKR